MVILIAAAIGIPVGFLGGVYLAEFGGKTVPMMIRYTADLLNGVPSIVIGIFAWTVSSCPCTFFGLGRRIRAEPDDDPHWPAGHRAVSARRAQFAARRPLALGASKTRTVMTVIVPAAKQGILTGMILGVARIAGETAPLLFTSSEQSVLGKGLNEPTAALP